MTNAPAHDNILRDRSLEIETPEHVEVGYELAGPGSRFVAFALDAALLFVLILATVVGTVFALLGLARAGVPLAGATAAFAVMWTVPFALLWGYFAVFEGLRDGQTPGKKRLGLRVVQAEGFPVTFRDAVIRNLVRIVDIQPMPTCLLGGGLILLHPRGQRLGDLAAGTVVVRERRATVLPEEVEAEGPPVLSEEEYALLRAYLLRRSSLDATARRRVAARLARHFAAQVEANPDRLLARLYAEESGRRMAAGAGAGSGSAAAAHLFRQQRERWAEYEDLLARARRRGLAALGETEVSRFAALYREVATDLARARTYGASHELLAGLERSVGTGHNLLYSATRRTVGSLWGWLTGSFPALVRRRAWVILAAAVLLFGPAVATFAAVAADPGVARMVLPAEMIARAEQAPERAAAGGRYAEVPEVLMPVFSSQIITNNVQVSFFAFAGGILAGAGTILILLLNGVMIGGVFGLFRVEGADLFLWSFVAPHGVIELTAICIAGGAGLWMGSAFVLPGRQTRRDALVSRAREAVSLLGGAVVLLLVAGLVEGFVSPSALADEVKLAFGALTALVLFPFLALAGRRPPDHSRPRRFTSR